jgi:hypothetical protein
MMALTFSVRVAVSPRDAWRVLSDPAWIARWRPAFAGWIGVAPGALAESAALRFRARLRGVPVVAEQRVLALRRGARIESRVRYGLFGFDETITLNREGVAESATRIGLAVGLANQVGVVSGSLDRVTVRRVASELVEQTLASLSALCGELAVSASAAAAEPAPATPLRSAP